MAVLLHRQQLCALCLGWALLCAAWASPFAAAQEPASKTYIGTSDQANGLTIEVRPVLGPNAYATRHWDQYVVNVLEALERGIPCVGEPDSPAYAEFANIYEAHDVVCSDFYSWRGQANPAPPYDREFGQRVHFATRIISANQPFTLHRIQARWHSNFEDLELPDSDLSKESYRPNRVGIHYGEDGQPGTEDDRVYKAGEAGDLPIHELRYSGVGCGWAALARDRSAPTETLQGMLDATAYELSTGRDLVLGVTYAVLDAQGKKTLISATAEVTVHAAPKPDEQALAVYAANMDQVTAGTEAAAAPGWRMISFYVIGGLLIIAVLGSLAAKLIHAARSGPPV